MWWGKPVKIPASRYSQMRQVLCGKTTWFRGGSKAMPRLALLILSGPPEEGGRATHGKVSVTSTRGCLRYMLLPGPKPAWFSEGLPPEGCQGRCVRTRWRYKGIGNVSWV